MELLAEEVAALLEALAVALVLVDALVLELLAELELELEPLQPVNAMAGRAITSASTRAKAPFFMLLEDFMIPLIS